MGNLERLQELLKDVHVTLTAVESEIQSKEDELSRAKLDYSQTKSVLEDAIREKEQLEEVLNKCAIDVCKYRNEFLAIERASASEPKRGLLAKDFHFMLCFRSQYAAKDQTIIQAHKEVIRNWGYCWWGKFASKRHASGGYSQLEPFGESFDAREEGDAASALRGRVLERRERQEPVYLYLCDPNPPHTSLHVAELEDFVFGEQITPHCDERGHEVEDCARIPAYYFENRGRCLGCNHKDTDECIKKFKCNFWFKITSITKLDDIGWQFSNLLNCFTKDTIDFAVPILYPLVVQQITPVMHFSSDEAPLRVEQPIDFRIKASEYAHTDVPAVKRFYENLNIACKSCISAVESVSFSGTQNDAYAVRAGTQPDQLVVDLPFAYRTNHSPSRYVVYLDKRTTTGQRDKVLATMKLYFAGL